MSDDLPMPMTLTLAEDLARGAEAIAEELYNDTSNAAVRRVYNEQHRWPIWNDGGILFALRSALRAHARAKSEQAAARVATAQLKPQQHPSKLSQRRRKRRTAAQETAAPDFITRSGIAGKRVRKAGGPLRG